MLNSKILESYLVYTEEIKSKNINKLKKIKNKDGIYYAYKDRGNFYLFHFIKLVFDEEPVMYVNRKSLLMLGFNIDA